MKLYHGTCAKHLTQIAKQGIKPRGATNRSNWNHTIKSNSKAVYLTDAYALYFAINAAKGDDLLAILEVEMDWGSSPFVLPDEDFIAQALCHSDPNQDLIKLTKKVRNQIWGYQQHWGLSLNKMGTCCYHNIIPPEAITRVALADPTDPFIAFGMDPTITIMNYAFCAPKYRALNHLLFGDKVSIPDLAMFPQEQFPEQFESMRRQVESYTPVVFSFTEKGWQTKLKNSFSGTKKLLET